MPKLQQQKTIFYTKNHFQVPIHV